jgi:pyruvate dehydrogenase E2 component (dihydrolipoamide acetyltransferase)
MDLALELRERLGDISVDAMVVKAVALALRDHPNANGAYRDAKFESYSRVNIGVAAGDVAPTIFDADLKSLGEIARAIDELDEKVRGGTIAAPELAGGTFTVSSLDVERFTPFVVAPQACALGVGAARRAAVADDSGRIFNASVMTATLACDARILNGDGAAALLGAVASNLTDPLALSR